MLNRPTDIVCAYFIGNKCIKTAAFALTGVQTLCQRL